MIANVMLAMNPTSLINCPPMKARALATVKKIDNRSRVSEFVHRAAQGLVRNTEFEL